MASFVGSFAASHGPLLIREWQAVPAAEKSRLEQAFAELGRRLRAANPDVLVVVVGTGGLSHSIGEPTMGAIYEDFDRETIRLFGADKEHLIRYLEKELPSRGNGSEEVRNWLVAHGAAGGRGFELIDYLPVPTVIVGCGFAAWSPN